jgi:myo-inositol-1(or 4)-monophosphatase
LLVTGFPYDVAENPDNCIEHFVNFLFEGQAVRRMGSAAIDLAYVAASRYDGFWEVNLNAWDMAAGVLLIREAGGKVTGFEGDEIDIYGKRVVASNGLIHDEMVGLILKVK